MNSLAGYFFKINLTIGRDLRYRMTLLPTQQLARYGIFRTQYYIALNKVFEFTNIAGPGMPFQQFHHCRRERPYLNIVPGPMGLKEMSDQAPNISAAAP